MIGVVFKKKFKPNEVIINIQQFIAMLYTMNLINTDETVISDMYNFDEMNLELALEEGETITNKDIVLSKKDIYKIYK